MSNEKDIPYQQAGLVAQLQAERANAEAYGQKDRVAAVDKQLKSLGVKAEAGEKRKAAADDKSEAKAEPPKNRRSSEKTEG
jgi:hypothetical protein